MQAPNVMERKTYKDFRIIRNAYKPATMFRSSCSPYRHSQWRVFFSTFKVLMIYALNKNGVVWFSNSWFVFKHSSAWKCVTRTAYL